MRYKAFARRHPNPTVRFDPVYASLMDLVKDLKEKEWEFRDKLVYFHDQFHDLTCNEYPSTRLKLHWLPYKYFHGDKGYYVRDKGVCNLNDISRWEDEDYYLGCDLFKMENITADHLRQTMPMYENVTFHLPNQRLHDRKMKLYHECIEKLFDIEVQPLMFPFM